MLPVALAAAPPSQPLVAAAAADADPDGDDSERTPSPILGSAGALSDLDGDHVALPTPGPSSEDMCRITADWPELAGLEHSTALLAASDVEAMESQMGRASLDGGTSRPPDAGQAGRLLRHVQVRDRQVALLQAQRDSIRASALSALSSASLQLSRTVQAERAQRARVEVELDGVKKQAVMLSQRLAKSEALTQQLKRERKEMVINEVSAHVALSAARKQGTSTAPVPAHAPQPPPPAAPATPAAAKGKLNDDRMSISPALPHEPGPSLQSPVSVHPPPETPVYTAIKEGTDPSSPVSAIIKDRNKLLADKKFLKARVRDVEAQVERMQHELDLLRGFMVRSDGKRVNGGGGAITALWNASSIPDRPVGARMRAKEKARRKKVAVMGDAEAEHLLLAAKTLREKEKRDLERQERIKEEEEREIRRAVAAAAYPPLERRRREPAAPARPSTAPGTRSTGEQPSSLPRTPDKNGVFSKASPASARRPVPTTPFSAHALLSVAQPESGHPAAHPAPSANSPQHWSGSGARPDAHGAPPGSSPYKYTPHHRGSAGSGAYAQSGIDGLLQAAQLVTPGGTRVAQEAEDASASPKRRRVNSSTPRAPEPRPALPAAGGVFDSPSRAPPMLPSLAAHARTQSQNERGLTALDVLADQAAASQHPSQTSDWSGNSGTDEDGERRAAAMPPGPPHMYPPPPGYPVHAMPAAYYPRGPYPAPPYGVYEPPPRRRGTSSSASSAGAPVPGPPRPVDEGSPAKKGRKQDPAVRRVPYIRWTEPEDRKLRAAIKEYGQRWELISRAVGTRSYHQCRQRYLLMRRKEAAQQGHSLANHPRLDADRVGPYYEETENKAAAMASSSPPVLATAQGREGTEGRSDSLAQDQDQDQDQDQWSDCEAEDAEGDVTVRRLPVAIKTEDGQPGPSQKGKRHASHDLSPPDSPSHRPHGGARTVVAGAP